MTCLLPPPPPLSDHQVSGLSALAACHYLVDQRERVFQVLYKAINSSVKELQEAGKASMKKVNHTIYLCTVVSWVQIPPRAALLFFVHVHVHLANHAVPTNVHVHYICTLIEWLIPKPLLLMAVLCKFAFLLMTKY